MYIKAFWRPLVSNSSSRLSTSLVSDPPCSHRLAAWSFKWKTWSSVSTFDIILQESVFHSVTQQMAKFIQEMSFLSDPLKIRVWLRVLWKERLEDQPKQQQYCFFYCHFCGPVCIYATQQRVSMKFQFFFEIWIISRVSSNLTAMKVLKYFFSAYFLVLL